MPVPSTRLPESKEGPSPCPQSLAIQDDVFGCLQRIVTEPTHSCSSLRIPRVCGCFLKWPCPVIRAMNVLTWPTKGQECKFGKLKTALSLDTGGFFPFFIWHMPQRLHCKGYLNATYVNVLKPYVYKLSIYILNPLTAEYNATHARNVVSQYQVYLLWQFPKRRVFKLLIKLTRWNTWFSKQFRETPSDLSIYRFYTIGKKNKKNWADFLADNVKCELTRSWRILEQRSRTIYHICGS
jgi:hypothetical protein